MPSVPGSNAVYRAPLNRPLPPRGRRGKVVADCRGREHCSSLRVSKKHPDGQGQSPCPTSPCQFRPDSPALRPVAVPGPGPSMSRSPTVREGTRPGRCFGEAAAQSRSCSSEGHVVGLAARPSHGGRHGWESLPVPPGPSVRLWGSREPRPPLRTGGLYRTKRKLTLSPFPPFLVRPAYLEFPQT